MTDLIIFPSSFKQKEEDIESQWQTIGLKSKDMNKMFGTNAKNTSLQPAINL